MLISDLVASLTSQTPNLSTLAHEVGLNPHVQKWVNSIRPRLCLTAIQMINQETVEDCLVPHAQELLEAEWLRKQTEIQTQLQAKSDQYQEQLTADMEVMIEAKKQSLQHAADEYLRNFKHDLDATTADDVQRIKNKSKSIIQQAKDEEELQALQSVIRTPKASKLSPLNISKPKKKKKKQTILDLTTPSPGNEPSDNYADMETDTDSTPTMPICHSSAPSPAPIPHDAPDTVPTTVADPNSISQWAQTPSPDDKTPHAPSFTITAPTNPPPATDLSVVLAVIAGLRSELTTRIDEVNACVDLASGPQTIADHVVWNEANLSAWEHPGYVDPQHNETMESLADANAAHEAHQLETQHLFRNLHLRFVSEKRMTPLDDNEVYLEKWYEVCSDIIKSMNWDIHNLSTETDDTFLNAWRHAECILNEEEYNFSTYHIFEHITGSKPNTSSPEGQAHFNTFTTAYNNFCASENFPAWEGFPESNDRFFKYFLSKAPQSTAPVKTLNPPLPATKQPPSSKSV